MLSCKIPGWFHRDSACRPDYRQIIIAVVGSFAGIAAVSYLSMNYSVPLLVPSFGASAVLLYAACHVPMAQPRNVVGGHLISAVAGVSVYQLLGLTWWSLALAVTLAIGAMMFTDTLHPPGGATAFAAVFTTQDYSFVFSPVLLGAVILVSVAIAVNNVGIKKYPVRVREVFNGETVPDNRPVGIPVE